MRYDPGNEITESLLTLFDQAALRNLVEQALLANPDLKRTHARMTESGFSLRIASAGLVPAIRSNLSAAHSQPPRQTNARETPSISNTFTATLDTIWEIDVWGKIRSGRAAAQADQAALTADYQAAKQSLAAQTMQAWFQLTESEKLLALDQRRVESFESTKQRVQRRFDVGQATLGQLELAETDTENARADVQQTLDLRDQAARQVRVLLGDYPDHLLTSPEWPSLKRHVQAGLPSELLLRRPDIRAAYSQIRAADARVQVAYADLFPSFALTASGGRQSDRLEDLARSSFNTWSLLGNITTPIFEGGRLRAVLGVASKRAEQAYFNYQSTVLSALQEVENTLGSEHFLAAEESARLTALKSAQAAFQRAQRDYEAGVSDLLTLLEAQRGVFNTERQSINVHAARLNNRVALALALGKGV